MQFAKDGGLTMRRLVLMVAAFACAGAAFGQRNYPARPVRMVIPWPPGQAMDVVGRIMAMQGSGVRERLIVAGVEVDYRRSDDFAQYLKGQKTRFSEVIRRCNIRIE